MAIMNSDFDLFETAGAEVSEIARSRILDTLDDVNNIVALFQKSFYDHYRFNVNDRKFDDITPAQYRKAMNNAVMHLHDRIFEAIERTEDEFKKELGL